MHLFFPSVLLTLCAGGEGRDHGVSADSPPLVARVYDLSALRWGEFDGHESALFPHFDAYESRLGAGAQRFESEYGWDPHSPEEGAELLVALLGEELHHLDCQWNLGAAGRWLLIAPEPIHTRAAAALAAIEEHVNATVRLRVDIIEGDGGTPPTADGPERAAQAQVEALVDRARARGALRTVHLELGSGRAEVLDLSRALWSVLSYSSDVAQGMLATAPRVAVVPVGLRLTLCASPGRGGVHLAGMVQDSSLREDPQTRRIARSGLLGLDSGQTDVALPGAFTSLALEHRTFTLNAHLRRGEALILGSEQDAAHGGRSQQVILRLVRGELPSVTSFGTQDGRMVVLLDTVSLEPALARNFGLLAAIGGRPRVPHSMREVEHPLLGALLELGDPELFDELNNLGSDSAVFEQDQYSRHRVLRFNEGASMPELVQLLELLAPPVRNLELSFVLRRSGSGEVVASCNLPVTHGKTTSVLLGTELGRMFDYEVEIAQGASVSAPRVDSLFDGLVLAVRTHSNGRGEPMVDVQAYVSLLEGDEGISLGTRFYERIDAPRLLTLFAGRTLPADGQVHLLGDEGSSAGSLVLEVRAR